MTARATRLDAVLAVLDGATVDHGALDEALTILAANLRRQKRDGPRLLRILRREGRSLLLSRGGPLVHEADPMGDGIAVIARADSPNRNNPRSLYLTIPNGTRLHHRPALPPIEPEPPRHFSRRADST